MFTSAAKRYAIDPAVESITCKISLIYLNDHLDVDMKVPSCNAKMEVFFQPKRRKKPIAFNPCFPLKIYPLVFVGIHYLVSMNNVRRITFGTLRKRDFLRFFSSSSSRFDFLYIYRPARPAHTEISRFNKPHVHLKVNFHLKFL